ncbi:MAG: DUF4093 domain-containing protein [Firmicutes bacterium]|nr:DUF4093 domain-containing protein [Bacillota bacterium]
MIPEGERLYVKQAVVVEGRDDESAVLRALDCCCIATHGWGIKPETLEIIRKACDETGIIIFTDPDHAGLKIREKLTKLFPSALQAHLTRGEAEKDGDIGIENASPEAIRAAVLRALSSEGVPEGEAFIRPLSEELCGEAELFSLGLIGASDSALRREAAGKALGLGGGNAKSFLKKLRHFKVSKEELERACRQFPQQKR